MSDREEPNVYLLAGGASRRMGLNKALIRIGGETVVSRALRLARRISPRVFLSTSDGSPAGAAELAVPVVPDSVTGKGPLGAILSCLESSDRERNLFLPCDLPFLTERILRLLLDTHVEETALCLSSPAGFEPLVGIYTLSALPCLRDSLAEGRLDLHHLYELPGWSTLPLAAQEDPPWFFNLNTPEDLARLREYESHA